MIFDELDQNYRYTVRLFCYYDANKHIEVDPDSNAHKNMILLNAIYLK